MSLGLSLTPQKTCNLDCLYCQLGKTVRRVDERCEYISIEDILGELKSWLDNNPEEVKELNYITLSGAGEPTLNSGLGKLIGAVKKLSKAKIAVITNSTLLPDARLRADLAAADLIVPSLDAATVDVFDRINRPDPKIDLNKVIEGLVDLKKEFHGKIWLEVMLVAGINDDIGHIRKLKEAIDRINPDKIQLNSPVRTTAEPGILPVAKEKLEQIREMFGSNCEII